MFNITRKTVEWGGRTLTLETGRIARQADGAVLVTYGNTAVLCTAVAAKEPKPDIDFFPLTVHYQEKILRRRPHSRWLFQARRPPDREGRADQPPDRPADPPAVPGRLLPRHAG